MMANQTANSTQNQQARNITEMIRGIELGEAERQARDEAALKAAKERGEAAGRAEGAAGA